MEENPINRYQHEAMVGNRVVEFLQPERGGAGGMKIYPRVIEDAIESLRGPEIPPINAEKVEEIVRTYWDKLSITKLVQAAIHSDRKQWIENRTHYMALVKSLRKRLGSNISEELPR